MELQWKLQRKTPDVPLHELDALGVTLEGEIEAAEPEREYLMTERKARWWLVALPVP